MDPLTFKERLEISSTRFVEEFNYITYLWDGTDFLCKINKEVLANMTPPQSKDQYWSFKEKGYGLRFLVKCGSWVIIN